MAVIGSGPAGLTVAGDLARQGFNVTIFEGQPEPGGVLMYGIPEYRLPKAVVRNEIKRIEALGVHFVTNCLVGAPESGVTVDSLFAQGFDAIFMGTGTALPQNLNVPGLICAASHSQPTSCTTSTPTLRVPCPTRWCHCARATAWP